MNHPAIRKGAVAVITGAAVGIGYAISRRVASELDQRRMQWAADDMIKNRPALSRWHEDYADQFAAYIADVANQ